MQGATNYPKKQCFCKAGFFGVNCEKTSDITSKAYNVEDFASSGRGGKVEFLYKVVGDVLEGIIIGKTQSWVAVGKLVDEAINLP